MKSLAFFGVGTLLVAVFAKSLFALAFAILIKLAVLVALIAGTVWLFRYLRKQGVFEGKHQQ